MSEKKLVGINDLIKEIGKRRGLKNIRYCVWVRPFMPTTEDRGFQGTALVNVTRKEFIKAATNLLINLEARGARIELSIPTENYEEFII